MVVELLIVVLFKCITCIRYRASSMVQRMSSLPYSRVNRSPPFSHVGINYAGLIKIRSASGRGYHAMKGYIVVFICFSTKAVHLEAVTGYDSKKFLNAFKRFIARRGLCTDVYFDCGTPLVGADSELISIFSKYSTDFKKIINDLSDLKVTWHFNPPASPNFGGLWEAAIKSFKFHLKRVLGENSLTYEELSTLFCNIEVCLNSRPLCPVLDDSSDLAVLTPVHFLIGRFLFLCQNHPN